LQDAALLAELKLQGAHRKPLFKQREAYKFHVHVVGGLWGVSALINMSNSQTLAACPNAHQTAVAGAYVWSATTTAFDREV
jgi:hypothetical protein